MHARDREPLLAFMLAALRESNCRILYSSGARTAPFRIVFETREGERFGVIAYAFLANSRKTRNRPVDEHRFQIKYGSDTEGLHAIWQDPFNLYTTLLLGIDPELGFFVGADPVLHDPTPFFISVVRLRFHDSRRLYRLRLGDRSAESRIERRGQRHRIGEELRPNGSCQDLGKRGRNGIAELSLHRREISQHLVIVRNRLQPAQLACRKSPILPMKRPDGRSWACLHRPRRRTFRPPPRFVCQR